MKYVVLGVKTRAPGSDPGMCFRSALSDFLAICLSWGFKGLYIPPCMGEKDVIGMLLHGYTCDGAYDNGGETACAWVSASGDTASGAIPCDGAHCDICIARLGGRIDSFISGITTKMRVVDREKADD